jgi:hypothetical protein
MQSPILSPLKHGGKNIDPCDCSAEQLFFQLMNIENQKIIEKHEINFEESKKDTSDGIPIPGRSNTNQLDVPANSSLPLDSGIDINTPRDNFSFTPIPEDISKNNFESNAQYEIKNYLVDQTTSQGDCKYFGKIQVFHVLYFSINSNLL